jgi:hypothetical protein
MTGTEILNLSFRLLATYVLRGNDKYKPQVRYQTSST